VVTTAPETTPRHSRFVNWLKNNAVRSPAIARRLMVRVSTPDKNIVNPDNKIRIIDIAQANQAATRYQYKLCDKIVTFHRFLCLFPQKLNAQWINFEIYLNAIHVTNLSQKYISIQYRQPTH
jgi:hypothetical protein